MEGQTDTMSDSDAAKGLLFAAGIVVAGIAAWYIAAHFVWRFVEWLTTLPR